MNPLLVARGLCKDFSARGRALPTRAVIDLDLEIEPGEVFGLVGESGSGKTTLARMLTRLVEPTAGAIQFRGIDLLALRGSPLRAERRKLQMIFQDPYASLDPRMRVADSIFEPLAVHRLAGRAERDQRVSALLSEVGLPAATGEQFPEQLSGGQRQRIGIARALATDPELLIADEPVAALDMSVRAQILNLLAERKRERNLTLLLIAHDLPLVARTADRVAVLFRGRVVESGPAARVLEAPQHPYSALLRASIPGQGGRNPVARIQASRPLGELRPAADSGCPYLDRCPVAENRCREERPLLSDLGEGLRVACHFPGALSGE